MGGTITVFGRNRAIDAALGDAVSAASAMYLALSTALPASPESATLANFNTHEITTSGYSRQAVTWNAPSGGTVTNAGTVDFGAFSADPPEVSHVFECDTSTGTSGNVIAFWSLDTARDAGDGDIIRISPTDLSMSVDSCP